MKKIALALVASLAMMITLPGCTYEKPVNGQMVSCVGLGETHNEKYNYDVSTWNVVMAAIGVSLFAIPTIVVVSDAWSCPTSLKEVQQTP